MAYKNKEDQKEYAKKHYASNKKIYKERAKKRNQLQRKKNREYTNSVKENSQCVDCGESNPIVLDFDHVRGLKVDNIADMVGRPCSINKIEEEIKKCEIRCANCHRIVTHNRRTK